MFIYVHRHVNGCCQGNNLITKGQNKERQSKTIKFYDDLKAHS